MASKIPILQMQFSQAPFLFASGEGATSFHPELFWLLLFSLAPLTQGSYANRIPQELCQQPLTLCRKES